VALGFLAIFACLFFQVFTLPPVADRGAKIVIALIFIKILSRRFKYRKSAEQENALAQKNRGVRREDGQDVAETKTCRPSHFSTIGMPVNSPEEMVALAKRVVDNCASLDCPQGRYLRWSSPSGAELWLQIDAENSLVGMCPHFSGESAVRIGLTDRVIRPDGTALDGAFHGWAEPADDDPESGCYPFVFDAPDFLLHRELQLPAVVKAQIAAFAHEVSLFPSPGAYDASLPPAGPSPDNPELLVPARGFASQSFIPSGLFSPGGQTTDPPQAHAIFTGHILKTETRRNELTGREFYWALVETLGGTFDVIIDPGLVESAPKVGGVLQGAFWLSGRLLGEMKNWGVSGGQRRTPSSAVL
jgi:hypothetical protein